eukprot:scaffold10059_cov123-Isochrysis_galbana.AAC.14
MCTIDAVSLNPHLLRASPYSPPHRPLPPADQGIPGQRRQARLRGGQGRRRRRAWLGLGDGCPAVALLPRRAVPPVPRRLRMGRGLSGLVQQPRRQANQARPPARQRLPQRHDGHRHRRALTGLGADAHTCTRGHRRSVWKTNGATPWYFLGLRDTPNSLYLVPAPWSLVSASNVEHRA